MTLGYVIGRFNFLHLGHHELIDHMIANTDTHIIFIGSADKFRTESNPLTGDEREHLLSIHYPNSKIIQLNDFDDMDKWKKILNNHIANEVDDKFNKISIFSPVREDDHTLRSNWIDNNHSIETFKPTHDLSATELRLKWYKKENFSPFVKKSTGLFLDTITI
jgi:cytidyltransferase-like protein